MNASLIGNDGTGLNVWQGGEDKLQQMHGRGIVSVMDHGWSDIWEEILFDGKLVEPGEKSECLLIGHAGDKFHGAQVKTSTVYVISEADAITDSAAIKNYGAKVPETLAPFSGHYHFVVRGR